MASRSRFGLISFFVVAIELLCSNAAYSQSSGPNVTVLGGLVSINETQISGFKVTLAADVVKDGKPVLSSSGKSLTKGLQIASGAISASKTAVGAGAQASVTNLSKGFTVDDSGVANYNSAISNLTLLNVTLDSVTIKSVKLADEKDSIPQIDVKVTIDKISVTSIEKATVAFADLAKAIAASAQSAQPVLANGTVVPMGGDIIELTADAPNMKLWQSADANKDSEYCAPAGTRLYVVHDKQTTENTYAVTVHSLPGHWWRSWYQKLINLKSNDDACDPSVATNQGPVKENVQYLAPQEILLGADRYTRGFDFGVLITPYKYYRYNGNLSGSATVGTYVGYHDLSSTGTGWEPVISVGLQTASAGSQGSASSQSSSTNVSLSAALGMVVTITKGSNRLQAAVLAGREFGNPALANGSHKWIGIGLGTNLTQ